jgi:hypothetical protein
MTQAEALRVYTVESNFVRAFDTPFLPAFHRVVGIVDPGGYTSWASPYATHDPASAYNRSDATELRLNGSRIFNRRLFNFFQRLFVQYDTRLPDYNCHAFAGWMTGLTDIYTSSDITGATQLVTSGALALKPLELGQHGALGIRLRSYGAAMHSVIGLGPDNPNCIQVMQLHGHIGIAPYTDVHRYYDRPDHYDSSVWQDYGLYA